MFRSVRTYLLLLLLGYLLCGCSHTRSYAPQLDRAEALMEEMPDSSFTLLSTIPADSLRRDEKARYALLLYQSRHKTNRPNTSDSLINIAVDRYSRKGPDSLLMKSLFYRAVAYMELNRLPQSIKDATHAFDLASSANNHYWKAKSAELIADIYGLRANNIERIKWTRIVVQEYQEAGRQENYLFALVDLAAATGDGGHVEESLQLFDSISSLIEENPYVFGLEEYLHDHAINVMAYYGSIDQFDRSLRFFINKYGIDNLPKHCLIAVGKGYLRKGDTESAKRIFDDYGHLDLDFRDSILLEQAYIDYAKTVDNKELSISSSESLLQQQVALFQNAYDFGLFDVRNEYYMQSRERVRDAGHRRVQLTWIITGSVCLVSLIIAALIIRGYRKRSRREILTVSKELADLKHKYDTQYAGKESDSGDDETNESSFNQNSIYEKFTKTGLNLLNLICEELVRTEEETKESPVKNHISGTSNMKKLKIYLDNVRTNDSDQIFENLVNCSDNMIVSRITSQYPQMKQEDIHFITLCLAGLSARTISYLYRIKSNSVYRKRNRIITFMEENPTVDSAEFVNKLQRYKSEML